MEDKTEDLKEEMLGGSEDQQTDTKEEESDAKQEETNIKQEESHMKQECSETTETVTEQDTVHKEDDEENGVLETQQSKTEDTDKDEDLEEENIKIDPEVIEKLTTGVLGLFLPNLQKARGSLNECLHNQEVLIETVQQENAKFSESTPMQQLIRTMQEARVYHSKLVNLKKEMNILTDRSAKIKKRAVRLQQQKQKEELEKAAQKDREVAKERMLAAKIAKSPK